MKPGAWRMAGALMAAGTLSGCAAALIPVLAGGMVATGADKNADAVPPEAPRPASAEVALPGTSEPPPAPAPSPSASPARPAPVVSAPLARLQLTSFDPAFARFAEYVLAAQRAATPEAPANSALLADPVALDGATAPCRAEQSPVVVIDLDPAGGQFTAPASLPSLPEHAAALASLREAGITIAWISQSPITQTGAIRSAIEGTGLDPQGADVVALARDPADRKQVLREQLASNSCILAIAGDERTDFDERFGYLRNPAAGARLETLIGEGPWFLIRNIFSSTPSTGTSAP